MHDDILRDIMDADSKIFVFLSSARNLFLYGGHDARDHHRLSIEPVNDVYKTRERRKLER